MSVVIWLATTTIFMLIPSVTAVWLALVWILLVYSWLEVLAWMGVLCFVGILTHSWVAIGMFTVTHVCVLGELGHLTSPGAAACAASKW